jgi:actin-related protein 5
MEAELREIDPEYTHQKDEHHLNSTNQLFLFSDLIKCHEIYFEPLLIGLNQMNVIETIVSLLPLYDKNTKRDLLKNVIIIGGASKVPGLKERVERDLRRECPVELDIKVKIGKGGSEGAFLAMQNISKTQKEFI